MQGLSKESTLLALFELSLESLKTQSKMELATTVPRVFPLVFHPAYAHCVRLRHYAILLTA
jgi:hypothetical protein